MIPVSNDLRHSKAMILRACGPVEGTLLAWSMVCGKRIAEKTQARDFDGQILTVHVLDKGWKNEMELLAPQFLQELNKISPSRVSRVCFIID